MLNIRFSAIRVWTHFAIMVVGVLVIFLISDYLTWADPSRHWYNSPVGWVVLAIILLMLLIGAIKRSVRSDPILTLDERGIRIHLPSLEIIPWSAVRAHLVWGLPWVFGRRLTLDYAGTAPKLGYMTKLNWGVLPKQRGEVARISLVLDQTDQSIPELEASLARFLSRRSA